MPNKAFQKTSVLAAGSFCVLLYSLSSFAETADQTTDSGVVQQLHRLGERIDSIEVEKQIKKRNGQSLADLEERTANLRDSIKTIQLEIGKGTVPHTAAQPGKKDPFMEIIKKTLPDSKNPVYDRILLAAGAITIVVGIFFLFILVALKSRNRKRAVSRNQTEKMAARYKEVQRKVANAQNTYPDAFTASALESAALASAIPSVPPDVPAAAPPTPTRLMPKSSEGDLKDLVLKAGKKGLDAKEISRQYHISIDQVTLILKMAKKQ